MEEEQQGGVSLGEILSMVWKRIIWILGISVAAALVCWLVVNFAVSPKKQQYNLSFIIEYPDQYAKDSDKMQYPDGSVFRMGSVIYVDRLNAAKATDKNFEKIDTEKMAASGDILIAPQSGSENDSGIYTITVSSTYFKNGDQATAFLKAVCDVTRLNVLEKAASVNVFSELVGYDGATLEKQLDLLETRHASILKLYENYRDRGLYKDFTYGEKTLEERYLEVSAVNFAIVRIAGLEHEMEENEAAIEALTAKVKDFMPDSSSSEPSTAEGLNAYHEIISKYTERNAQIKVELTRLYASVGYNGAAGGYSETADFNEKLDALYGVIVSETATYNEMVTALYENYTSFNYGPSRAYLTGGASAVKYALVVFVVAFVIACAVFCTVDYNRKKKAAGEPVENAPSPAPEAESADSGQNEKE